MSQRTFTAADFRKASSAVWLATDKEVAAELEVMLLQAAAAESRWAQLKAEVACDDNTTFITRMLNLMLRLEGKRP